MAKPKIRAFRFELAICIGAPLVILAAIIVVGYGHIRTVKGEVARREALMIEIPVVEHQLMAVDRILASFSVRNAERDKSGELSQEANRSAVVHGIKVKSVNAEKVAIPESPSTLDYRVAMSGEGSLGAVVRVMDSLDQSVQCFKVSAMKVRAKYILPRPTYDVEWQFQYRFIPPKTGEVPPVAGDGAEQLKRLGTAAAALQDIMKAKKKPLDTAKLETRNMVTKQEPVFVAPEKPVSFRLHGVAQDGRGSLALTDQGVFGVGDTIDGYRVIKVASDHVIVESQQGRRESIPLYRGEAKP